MYLLIISFVISIFISLVSQNCIASDKKFDTLLEDCTNIFTTRINFILIQQELNNLPEYLSTQPNNPLTVEQIRQVQLSTEECKSLFGLSKKLTAKGYRVDSLPTLDDVLNISTEKFANNKLLIKKNKSILLTKRADTTHLETAYSIKKATACYLRDFFNTILDHEQQIDEVHSQNNQNNTIYNILNSIRQAREFNFEDCVHLPYHRYKTLWIEIYKTYLALKEQFPCALAALLINFNIDKSHLLNLVFCHSSNNNSNEFKRDLISDELTTDDFNKISNEAKINLFHNLYRKFVYFTCCIKTLQATNTIKKSEDQLYKRQVKIDSNTTFLVNKVATTFIENDNQHIFLEDDQRRLKLQETKDRMIRKRVQKSAYSYNNSNQLSIDKSKEQSGNNTNLKDIMKSFEEKPKTQPEIRSEKTENKTVSKLKKQNPKQNSTTSNIEQGSQQLPPSSNNTLVAQSVNKQTIVSSKHEDQALDKYSEDLTKDLEQMSLTAPDNTQSISAATSIEKNQKKKKKKKKNGNGNSYIVGENLGNLTTEKSIRDSKKVDNAVEQKVDISEDLGKIKIIRSDNVQNTPETKTTTDIKDKKKKKKSKENLNESKVAVKVLPVQKLSIRNLKKEPNVGSSKSGPSAIKSSILVKEENGSSSQSFWILDNKDLPILEETSTRSGDERNISKKTSLQSYVYGSVAILKREKSEDMNSPSDNEDQTSEPVPNKSIYNSENDNNVSSISKENINNMDGKEFFDNLEKYKTEEIEEEEFFRKSFQGYEKLLPHEFYRLLSDFYYSKALINNPCLCSSTVQDILNLIKKRKNFLYKTPEYLNEIYSADMDFVFCLRIQHNLSSANDQDPFKHDLINYLEHVKNNIHSRLNRGTSIQAQNIIYELSLLNGWEYNYSTINFVKKIF